MANATNYAFGLRHLFWVVAVYSASIVSFGLIGAFIATVICLIWASAAIFNDLRLAYGLIAGTTIGVVLPAATSRVHYHSIAASASPYCLGEVARAVRQYRLDHGELPPTTFKGSDGESIHSWRVLLLPYLGENDLYRLYRFDEPWDGPRNRALHCRCPYVYQNWRSDEDSLTGIVAITGDKTAWHIKTSDTDSELGQKVLLAEASESIPWLAPRDETFDAQRLARQKPIPSVSGMTWPMQEFFFRKTRGRHIGLYDGSSTTTKSPVDAATWTGLIDVDLPAPDTSSYVGCMLGEWRVHTPAICRVAILLFVATIPPTFMWLQRRDERKPF